jgi:deoxyribonucleoside regulator
MSGALRIRGSRRSLASMLEEDELLAVRAAELYYDEGKTQDEVGALLALSRWKVGRLLADARAQGIVRIEIVHPRARRLAVERQLRERFGLADAIVVPAPDDEGELLGRVAQAAADHLAVHRPVPRTLGVSWGRTLAAVAERLAAGWAHGVTVVQINGGVTLNRRPGVAAPTASAIAQKAEGEAVLLPSPAILERTETKRAIESDRVVADALARAASASAYLFTAGAAVDDSALVESGYLGPDDVAELVRKGAVGDVLGRFVDADGNIVDPALDERTVGLGLDRLRAAETAIFVVAGRAKHDIARTVVTSGLCTVLVTDDATARALLEDA